MNDSVARLSSRIMGTAAAVFLIAQLVLELVNATIRQMKSDGSLRKLHEKYGLVYEITFLM